MKDKPTAIITTTALIAPLVALCCLGPVVAAAAVAGLFGWLGGLGLAYALGAALVAGIAIYLLRRRQHTGGQAEPAQACARPKSGHASRKVFER